MTTIYDVENERKYLGQARRDDPTSSVCHFCGGLNGFADDCGFWYILDPREPLVYREVVAHTPSGKMQIIANKPHPTCSGCYAKHGHYHTSIYGLGER